jgi:hypothetical protein
MIDVNLILKLQNQNIVDWHKELTLTQTTHPFTFIEENNKWNFLLWHEEDIARIKDIEQDRIVEAKRNIDKYNQARNNAMEKIDEWVLTSLSFSSNEIKLPLHSETPGMMIDRLSIMALKRFHMFEETVRQDAAFEHKNTCAVKVEVLDEQIEDLSNCLRELLFLLQNGQRRFKVYRQFKMYNDPKLNPELYKRGQQ